MTDHNTIIDKDTADHIAGCVCHLVEKYIQQHQVPVSEIPALFAAFKKECDALFAPAVTAEPEIQPATKAQIRNSITPDHLTSFLDGKQYKSLKRHLSTHGHTPESYRAKFGLGPDYPMVAASYAAQRSELAKSSGLGQIRRQQAAARKAQAA